MDGEMYEHPATQANLATLQSRGVILIEPASGRFASGLEGRGRLPEIPTLIGHIRRIMGREGGLKNRQVVVTAGGTREPLDPVRYISNHSSGKQGYAIAQAAIDVGAQVTLISTIDHLPVPIGAELVSVGSAAEMQQAVLEHSDCDVLIMAAAVADLRPTTIAAQKIKKQDAVEVLPLTKNEDILALVGERRRQTHTPKVVVGFAAETQNLIDNAQGKLERKNADLIIANDLTAPGAGFAGDTNVVTIITRGQEPETLPIMSKTAVAEEIIQRVIRRLSSGAEITK
jgi:phosphopantothenoylcysteine decarboxylase/phosphopantothenate--cysteine ligase